MRRRSELFVTDRKTMSIFSHKHHSLWLVLPLLVEDLENQLLCLVTGLFKINQEHQYWIKHHFCGRHEKLKLKKVCFCWPLFFVILFRIIILSLMKFLPYSLCLMFLTFVYKFYFSCSCICYFILINYWKRFPLRSNVFFLTFQKKLFVLKNCL